MTLKKIEKLKADIESIVNDEIFKVKFTGLNSSDQAMWMNEAKGYLIKCVGKLNKVLEVE